MRIQAVATQIVPVLTDENGNDLMMKDQTVLLQEIQQFALASLPQVLRRCHRMIKDDQTTNRDVIEAGKFIKSVADGKVPTVKTINGIVKKMSNQQLEADLDGIQ